MRAILIDDESDSIKVLSLQLYRHCPQVEIVGSYTDSMEGYHAILALKPELIFLDIEMPRMNGFQLLQKIGKINFQIIFTTAYDQYAVQAFRFSALDYLLKPIDTIDLVAAVKKTEQLIRVNPEQIELLRESLSYVKDTHNQRIALPHTKGFKFLEINQIVYCESESNYTRFHLENKEQYLISKTLGDVQETLEKNGFVRVHRKYLVNLYHVQKLVTGEGTYLLLSNGSSIPLARLQKDKFLEHFKWIRI